MTSPLCSAGTPGQERSRDGHSLVETLAATARNRDRTVGIRAVIGGQGGPVRQVTGVLDDVGEVALAEQGEMEVILFRDGVVRTGGSRDL